MKRSDAFMAKKNKNKIDKKTLTEDDKKAWNALRVTGHMTRRQLEEFIPRARVEHYVKDGLWTKEVEIKDGVRIIGYTPTSKGIRFAKSHLHLDQFYSSKSVHHDIKLADFYMAKSQEVRDTFKSETELRNEFRSMMSDLAESDPTTHQQYKEMWQRGEISTPDMSYTEVRYEEVEEIVEEVCYESITKNYKQSEIEAKRTFARIMKMQIIVEGRDK